MHASFKGLRALEGVHIFFDKDARCKYFELVVVNLSLILCTVTVLLLLLYCCFTSTVNI